MDEIYLIDYIDMIFLRAGFFTSKEDAQAWIDRNSGGASQHYKIVTVDKAKDNRLSDRTYLRYAVQR